MPSWIERNLNIKISVREVGAAKVSEGFKKMATHTKQATDEGARFRIMTTGLRRNIGALRNELLVVAFAFAGIFRTLVGFVKAREMMESFEVRLQVLLGSVSRASQLFKQLAEYAAKVPFEYKEIMESGTRLAGIMKGGNKEIMDWIPLIGDLAAATGHSIEITTGQVMRMLSAGAQSADMFREHGVLAMLGFTAGVRYSAEETKKKLLDAWNTVDSQFKGATDKLQYTWTGVVSMMSDAWFKFSEGMGKIMIPGLVRITKFFQQAFEDMDNWARNNAKILEEKLGAALSFVIDKLKIFSNIISAIGKIFSTVTLNFSDFTMTLLKVFVAVKTLQSLFKVLSTLAGISLVSSFSKLGYVLSFIPKHLALITGFSDKIKLLTGMYLPSLLKLTSFWVISLTALMYIIKKVSNYIEEMDNKESNLMAVEIDRLKVQKSRVEVMRDEARDELKSIQAKINLKGRILELVESEKYQIEVVKRMNTELKNEMLVIAQLEWQQEKLKKTTKEALMSFVSKPVEELEKKYRDLISLGPGMELFTNAVVTGEREKNIELTKSKAFWVGLVKMSEEDIRNKMKSKNATKEQINSLLELRSKYEAIIRIEEMKIVKDENAVKIETKMDKKRKTELEQLDDLMRNMKQEIALTETKSDLQKRLVELNSKYEDSMDKIVDFEHITTLEKKEAIKVLDEYSRKMEKFIQVEAARDIGSKLESKMQDRQREIQLMNIKDSKEKENLKLIYEEADMIKSVMDLHLKDSILQDIMVGQIKEGYDWLRKYSDEAIKSDNIFESLADIGKKFRGARSLATQFGGEFESSLKLGMLEETKNKALEILRDYLWTAKELQLFGVETITQLENKIIASSEQEKKVLVMDSAIQVYNQKRELMNKNIELLEAENSVSSRLRLGAARSFEGITQVMDKVSEQFFHKEMLRHIKLKNVAGAMAMATSAMVIEEIKNMAAIKSAEAAWDFVMSGFRAGHKAAAAAGYAALAGTAGGIAAGLRGRAEENLAIAESKSEQELASTESTSGNRNYGSTTVLPPQNITIAPSISIEGDNIFVGSGSVQQLEKSMADMCVKSVENAIRSGQIDLTRVTNNR